MGKPRSHKPMSTKRARSLILEEKEMAAELAAYQPPEAPPQVDKAVKEERLSHPSSYNTVHIPTYNMLSFEYVLCAKS